MSSSLPPKYLVLRLKSRTLCMVGNCFITEVQLRSFCTYSKTTVYPKSFPATNTRYLVVWVGSTVVKVLVVQAQRPGLNLRAHVKILL